MNLWFYLNVTTISCESCWKKIYQSPPSESVGNNVGGKWLGIQPIQGSLEWNRTGFSPVCAKSSPQPSPNNQPKETKKILENRKTSILLGISYHIFSVFSKLSHPVRKFCWSTSLLSPLSFQLETPKTWIKCCKKHAKWWLQDLKIPYHNTWILFQVFFFQHLQILQDLVRGPSWWTTSANWKSDSPDKASFRRRWFSISKTCRCNAGCQEIFGSRAGYLCFTHGVDIPRTWCYSNTILSGATDARQLFASEMVDVPTIVSNTCNIQSIETEIHAFQSLNSIAISI